MVTIKNHAEAGSTCIWCGREREGVEVETNDRSFTGFLCLADLKRVLRLKTAGMRPPSTRKTDGAMPSP